MKNLIMFLLLIFSCASFAQDKDNESLFTDEEKKAEAEKNPMSEAEEQAAKNYIHRGRLDTTHQEMCAKGAGDYKDICHNKDSAFDEGAMQNIEKMLPAVTAAYNAIVGGSGMLGAAGGGVGKAFSTFDADVADEKVFSNFFSSLRNLLSLRVSIF